MTTAVRLCAGECGADISHRYWNAIYCSECASMKKYESDRRGNKWRSYERRLVQLELPMQARRDCVTCGKDISKLALTSDQCLKCHRFKRTERVSPDNCPRCESMTFNDGDFCVCLKCGWEDYGTPVDVDVEVSTGGMYA